MKARGFVEESSLSERGLALALAPGLTPAGVEDSPSFFHGFATEPQVLARGLVTLADVTATRYFQYVPSTMRDPVLTAQGDRLRAESFSACNSVYARLDLLGAGFDGGDIAHGTTNVDIGAATRAALGSVARDQLLHLDVGHHGMTAATLTRTVTERPVQMPARWVRGLGNAAELHRGLAPAFEVPGAGAKAFIASLPPATGTSRSGWLSASAGTVKVTARRVPGAVHVTGLHRLSALKRVLVHVTGLTVHGPRTGESGAALVEVHLPAARLWLGLTAEAWRGHSGEGALLDLLAAPGAADDADVVAALLAFEPVIDVDALARGAALDASRVRSALAVLATSGRVGWDAHDEAWFHRELPDDPTRVERDNPRLVAARRLVEAGALEADEQGRWVVRATGSQHLVRPHEGEWRCTCTWFLTHGSGRGPCKHVLAARLVSGDIVVPDAAEEDEQ